MKRRRVGTGTENAAALAEWAKSQPREFRACLPMNRRGISDSLVIGSAIREHGTKFGDSSVGVDFSSSGDPHIACITLPAADLIDAIETIGSENPPRKIARLKALATTDIEASVMWAAKAATRSERRVTRFVTCRLVAPTPRAEALLATPAARLDRCPPRDPNPRRRRRAPRTKAASRHTSSTSSPHHAGHARAPDAAARWRRSTGPQAASTRPHLRRLRRPRAAPLRTHISASRHPVLAPCSHATLSHQRLLHPSTPAFGRFDPRGTPALNASTPRHAPETAFKEAESAPHVPLNACTHTRALHGRAMRAERSVRCSIRASATTSWGSGRR